MKQKIVIRVEMECERCRSKALALVAGTGGVDSVALAGDARDQVVVVGDGVDSIKLATALRRKVGPAHIVHVTTEANKKQEDGGAKKKPAAVPPELASSLWYYQYPPPQQPVTAVYEQPATGYPYAYYGCQSQARHEPDSVCSIM